MINPRWSPLAFFGLGAAILNIAVIVAALYGIQQLDDSHDRSSYMVALLLETVPIAFLGLWSVATIMTSRGKLRGLVPAAIGSFLASIGGLAVVMFGFAYAARDFFPNS